MNKSRKQSDATYPLFFFMVDSTDHVTGKTGLSPTVTISKNGASFASPSGAVSEVGNGLYKVAGNATDSNTVGELWIHATGTAADPTDTSYTVVAYDPFDAVRLGLTALPNAAVSGVGGLLTAPTTANTGLADLKQIDGLATNGNNATLSLKKLDIVNNSGTALVARSTAGNGHGIHAESSDSTKSGIYALGGGSGTFGNGITAVSGSGSVDTGNGFKCVGSNSGFGLHVTGANNAIVAQSLGTNGDGITSLATGTGHGIRAVGGSTSGMGVKAEGGGSGSGIYSVGGSSDGIGVEVSGGGSTGIGMKVDGTGGAAGIDADITGNITGNISGSVGSVTAVVSSNMTQIDGNATNGNNATLKLKVLDIRSDSTSTPSVSIVGKGNVNGQPGGTGMLIQGGGAGAAGGAGGKGLYLYGGNGTTVAGRALYAFTDGAFPNGGTPVEFYGNGVFPGLTITSASGYGVEVPQGISANITGTMTTVTNLTNAPTVGDLTATMKASVNTEVDSALNTVLPGSPTAGSANAILAALSAQAAIRPVKNTGYSNFMFPMFDATTKQPKTGLTVTAQRAIDGNPFASCSNSVVELGSGVYRINLSAGDLNGDKIMLRFSGTGADDQLIEIFTQG